MADDRYILKPLVDDGIRGYRLEIDEFMADNAMVNLFLLALSKLQKDSLLQVDGQPNLLNYYALSGIHGLPQEEWDGFPNNRNYGYCNHSVDTFPTWHRPYMFLYEAAIASEMVNQANLFSGPEEKARYLGAAARFRLPYWDPVMPRNDRAPGGRLDTVWGLPKLFAAEDVFVRTPESPEEFTSIKNPMFSFQFPTADDFNKHPERIPLVMNAAFDPVHTTRTPDEDGKTDNGTLNLAIQRQASNLATKMWKMLNPDETQTSQTTGAKVLVNELRPWNSFANARVASAVIGGERYATVSVESWHNGIHNMIGTGQGGFVGHMGSPPVAGYEPMFWMHHNNIDRLLSLYQALYGRNVDSQEVFNQLYPFKKNAKRECFTSADDLVKSYWTPGFGVPGGQQAPTPVIQAAVKQYLTDTYYWATNNSGADGILPNWPKDLSGSEALYGAQATSVSAPHVELRAVKVQDSQAVLVAREVPLTAKLTATPKDTPIKAAEVLQHAAAVNDTLPDQVVLSPSATEPKPVIQIWDANIKVRKFAFDGSFNIHIFIGWVKDDQTERFLTKKNEVGFTGVFASTRDESANCASCNKSRSDDVILEDVVPLTTQLTDYLDGAEGSESLIRDGDLKTIQSLEPRHVVPFLKEHLEWRITDLSSRLLVGQEQQAQLEVTITNRTFTPPDGENPMGVYGPATAYPEITADKAGGFGHVY